MIEPSTVAVSMLLPAALAGTWTFFVAKRSESAAGLSAWTWPGIIGAFLLGNLPSANSFSTWPWAMPGIAATMTVVFAVILLLTTWTKLKPWQRDLALAAAVPLVLWPTFPWASRGVMGFMILGAAGAISFLASVGLRLAIADSSKRGFGLLALLFGLAPLVAFSHANIQQSIMIGFLGFTIGVAALVGLIRGNAFLTGGGSAVAVGALVLLIVNAQMRYAAGPEQTAWESWLLALGPILFALMPWVFLVFSRQKDPTRFLFKPFIAAGLVALLAASLPLVAYVYETSNDQQTTPDWNYGSFGG